MQSDNPHPIVVRLRCLECGQPLLDDAPLAEAPMVVALVRAHDAAEHTIRNENAYATLATAIVAMGAGADPPPAGRG